MNNILQETLDSINKVLLGKEHQVKLVIACLLAKGHLLLEDLPGMGKTTHTISRGRNYSSVSSGLMLKNAHAAVQK